jgi:small conductance mechanosensitive channel
MDETVDVAEVLQFLRWEFVPFAVLVLVGVIVAQQVSRRVLDDLGERFTEWRLSLKKASAIGRLLLFVVGFGVAIASVLDLRSEALFALLGTIGLAVGFAFKDVLASLMAGVLLLIDEPFQVGDRVTFKGFYGEIVSIGFRSVRLVTLDDNLVTIPNSAFLTEAVASANAGALDCMVVIPFHIAPTDDFVLARRLVTEAGASSRYVYLLKPLVTTLREGFVERHFVTTVEIKAYVFDARYEKAFVSDVTERVKLAFRQHGFLTPGWDGASARRTGEAAQPLAADGGSEADA